MNPGSGVLHPDSSFRRSAHGGWDVFMMTGRDKVFEQLLYGSQSFKAVFNNADNPKMLLKHQISLCDSPRWPGQLLQRIPNAKKKKKLSLAPGRFPSSLWEVLFVYLLTRALPDYLKMW